MRLHHPRIATQAQTCFMCPEQYEGTLTDGRYFYLRYRHGTVSLGLGADPGEAVRGTGAAAAMALGDGLQGAFVTREQADAAFATLLAEAERLAAELDQPAAG